MKKLYALLCLTISGFGFSQTFYSENFGVPSGTTTIANYITGTAPATFQNGAPIVYSGTGDIRSTDASTGYVGASGGGNVFLSNTTTAETFQIDGINSSAFNTQNLQLIFAYKANGTANAGLIVEVSTNGMMWTPLTFTPNANSNWNSITIGGGAIPSSTTLSIRFTQPTLAAQIRIDDVSVRNFNASCLLTLGLDTTACDASTLALDTYTATIPFTGGGTATYTITPSVGNIAGDNPSTATEGNILINGIPEGTNVTVSITGGTCEFTRVISSPECKPVNTLPYGESFDYAVGSSLNNSQKWRRLNTGDDITVATSSLSYNGYPSSANHVTFSGAGAESYSLFTNTTSGVLYASFLFSVSDIANITNDPFETVVAAITGDAPANFRIRLLFKRVGTQYQLGCTTLSALPAAEAAYGTTLFNLNDVVAVVLGYDFTANEVKMWLNPNFNTFNAATAATVTEVPATALTGLGGFLLRQDSNTGTPTILFDELRIADNIPNLLSTRSNEIAGLQIYPNPVNNGVVNIYTPSAAEKTIQVFDILGKQVMQTITSQEQINVSSLNSGIYILSISQEGNISRSKLIIK